MHARNWILVALAAALTVTGCRGGFRLNRYPTTDSLYAAGLREYEAEKWHNAIAAFEKLSTELSARDSLLPRTFWYLASAHARQREHLLAGQAFSRLFESFPDDPLADDAALEAGRSYRRLWRKPTLDPTYGEVALSTFNTLIGLYGETSEHADAARREIAELEEWFATKSYQTGRFYFRRRMYDSGIIYFQEVLDRWPHVPRARDALLRLAESYEAIRYREEYQETCDRLRESYPTDSDVAEVCRGAAATTTSRPAPTP